MAAHYHIRWSEKEELDWEQHGSRAAAETSAKQLVRSHETYTIEEHDEACSRCHAAVNPKTAHEDPKPKYPWQRAVTDAFKSRLQDLPFSVNTAERAISARLYELVPVDAEEQIAIHEALQSLHALLPQGSQTSERKPESDDKKQPA